MHPRHPNVTLAKWYRFPSDSLTQAFITPHVARLQVMTEPEYISIATRVVHYISSGDVSWQLPQEEPTCHALRLMTKHSGAWVLREGVLLNFENKAFARLTSLGRPYWRFFDSPRTGDDPSSDGGNCLLSYLGLEFLDLADVDEHERAHLLTPMNGLFD